MDYAHSIYGSFKDYCDNKSQSLMAVAEYAKKLRNDTDFFQKVCQVAIACISLLSNRYIKLADSLSRFTFSLNTANMHDFYLMLLRPQKWRFPISADSIDSNLATEDIFKLMPKFLEKEKNQIKSCVDTLLTEMSEVNQAFHSIEEFNEELVKRLKLNPLFSKVDFSELAKSAPKWVRHPTLGERITNAAWFFVDLGCIGLYFKDWNLIDTGKWAQKIGQYPVFQMVQNHRLESWVTGLVFTAFSFKLIESIRKLHDDKLSDIDKYKERWNVVTSFAESILFGASYLNLIERIKLNNTVLQCLTLVVKSIGLLSIVMKSNAQDAPTTNSKVVNSQKAKDANVNGSSVNSVAPTYIQAYRKVKSGIMFLTDETSRALHVIYSVEGFERLSKAMISNLRALSLIPALNGLFKHCIDTLEAAKDLYYGTLVFNSTADFIQKVGKRYTFQMPLYNKKDKNDKSWDWVKILYGVGNFFETAKFLQKYDVLSFPRCSKIANQLGPIKLFSLRGTDWTWNDIPVLNAVLDSPKDFCVFWAAFWQTGKCLTVKDKDKVKLRSWNEFSSWENILKLTGSIGKMVLVSSAQYMLRYRYMYLLTVVDVVTNNASLIGLLIKKYNTREEKFPQG